MLFRIPNETRYPIIGMVVNAIIDLNTIITITNFVVEGRAEFLSTR